MDENGDDGAMPGRTAHTLAGAAAGYLAASSADTTKQEGAGWEPLAGIAAGCIGGRLPDLLEPASTPNHRAVAHSAAVAVGLWWFWRAMNSRSDRETSRRPPTQLRPGEILAATVISAFVMGYLAHLALDLTTPRGLPCI